MSRHGCTIRRAGITPDGRAQLDLKADDGAFDWNFFTSSPDIGREILAIALTALTTGMHLDCELTDPIGGFTPIEYAFVVK